MLQQISKLVERTEKPDEIFDGFYELASRMNLVRFIYYYLPREVIYGQNAGIHVTRGYNPDSPVLTFLEKLMGSSEAKKWLKLNVSHRYNPFKGQDQLYPLMEKMIGHEMSLGDIVLRRDVTLHIPAHGVQSQSGLFTLAFDSTPIDPLLVRKMQIACQAIHQKFCEINSNKADKINYKLTKRELEVIVCVMLGKSNNEIGTILNISSNTVASHLGRICLKLDVKDRLSAAIKASEVGLFDDMQVTNGQLIE